jgi:hypothetical protein
MWQGAVWIWVEDAQEKRESVPKTIVLFQIAALKILYSLRNASMGSSMEALCAG